MNIKKEDITPPFYQAISFSSHEDLFSQVPSKLYVAEQS